MAQLVTEHIIWKTPCRMPAWIFRRYRQIGVRPEQIVDYLALIGDTVDNIPGYQGRPEDGGKMAGAV